MVRAATLRSSALSFAKAFSVRGEDGDVSRCRASMLQPYRDRVGGKLPQRRRAVAASVYHWFQRWPAGRDGSIRVRARRPVWAWFIFGRFWVTDGHAEAAGR
ncbi:MAG: hypothetical protein QOF70_4990 [Acetobacteraceae bacterium]|jgi:hypothetical protein|nr:hypothetical protein [Acetobacteraceae bacterium]